MPSTTASRVPFGERPQNLSGHHQNFPSCGVSVIVAPLACHQQQQSSSNNSTTNTTQSDLSFDVSPIRKPKRIYRKKAANASAACPEQQHQSGPNNSTTNNSQKPRKIYPKKGTSGVKKTGRPRKDVIAKKVYEVYRASLAGKPGEAVPQTQTPLFSTDHPMSGHPFYYHSIPGTYPGVCQENAHNVNKPACSRSQPQPDEEEEDDCYVVSEEKAPVSKRTPQQSKSESLKTSSRDMARTREKSRQQKTRECLAQLIELLPWRDNGVERKTVSTVLWKAIDYLKFLEKVELETRPGVTPKQPASLPWPQQMPQAPWYPGSLLDDPSRSSSFPQFPPQTLIPPPPLMPLTDPTEIASMAYQHAIRMTESHNQMLRLAPFLNSTGGYNSMNPVDGMTQNDNFDFTLPDF